MALALGMANAASASFPGVTGRIAFEIDRDVYSIEPNGHDLRGVPRGGVHTARITQTMHGLLIFSPGDAEHITQPVELALG